jgi:hypothetical protein
MKVKSFGCSFIYGSDLADDPLGYQNRPPSLLAWPGRLAQHMNLPYQSYAFPKSGNLRILEQLMSQVSTDDPALFIVGWSWIDRFDYVGEDDRHTRHPWKTIAPGDSTDLSQYYYKNFHTQFRDKLVTLSYIKLAIDTLKQKNHPFIMTYMDDLIFETKWHCNQAMLNMQEYIRPYMSNFEGMSILDWSRKCGYKISDAWHPLEQAHAAAGQHVVNNLDSYIKQTV